MARFVISPGMTPALLAHAANSTAPLIPGVATASEVMQALEAGYDHLKFFPAEAAGGRVVAALLLGCEQEVRSLAGRLRSRLLDEAPVAGEIADGRIQLGERDPHGYAK